MKPTHNPSASACFHESLIIGILALLFKLQSVQAASLYWDGDGVATGAEIVPGPITFGTTFFTDLRPKENS